MCASSASSLLCSFIYPAPHIITWAREAGARAHLCAEAGKCCHPGLTSGRFKAGGVSHEERDDQGDEDVHGDAHHADVVTHLGALTLRAAAWRCCGRVGSRMHGVAAWVATRGSMSRLALWQTDCEMPWALQSG